MHEAYLKHARVDRLTWKDRAHFFAVCAQAMRRVLVDHARRRAADKRGGGAPHLPIDDVVAVARTRPDDKEVVSCAWSSVLPSWRELSIWTVADPAYRHG